MGKSPGKWIRTLLLGKKSSKSNFSKRREALISANKEELIPASGLILNAAPISPHELGPSAESGVNFKYDGDLKIVTNLNLPEDPERIRCERAAIKAQAVFRGYLARRAFRALKGIIRLQALIRGHLVRRQAITTLYCVRGIVRFQALVRGRKVRESDIGIEVQGRQNLEKHQDAKYTLKFGQQTSTQTEKLSENAFVLKLLASSPTALPLRLQYGPGEPNRALNWLERWTNLRFWEPLSQPRKALYTKSHTKSVSSQKIESEQGRPRRSVLKVPAMNVKNGSTFSTSQFEKVKRNPRKFSSHPAVSIQEHSQNGIEKVKQNIRKISNPTEASHKIEMDAVKLKRISKKASGSAAPGVLEEIIADSAEKIQTDMTLAVGVAIRQQADVETGEKLPSFDEPVEELNDHSAVELQPRESNAKIVDVLGMDKEPKTNTDKICNENRRTVRRASLPAKQDNLENEAYNNPRVPSYMAATESAKARLRGQGSPSFGLDGDEKNDYTRRHSLPMSINGQSNLMSPRVQKVAQTSGKAGVKNDKSPLSSRDGSDKVMQPAWRR